MTSQDSIIYLEFDVFATAPCFHLKICMNENTVWSSSLSETHQHVKIPINDDDDRAHQIAWVLSGKTTDHTKQDQHGNLIEDPLAYISNITLDGADITKIMWQHAVYSHDFNGTNESVADKFFGCMGCNGILALEFETPVYPWMLERF